MEHQKVKRRLKDKSDRATVEKVLDEKTLKIIRRLAQRGKLFDFAGCISTGKEANVYTCNVSSSLSSKFISPAADIVVPGAIKIYQTSIMEFKTRARYIEKETRFQSFCRTNPRKLVKLWAEKEVRNLKRLNKAKIPSPVPVYLKNNVLIMTLIGNDESAAPRLKDAEIDNPDRTYTECIDLIRRMYREANLIHADLSEYNLLYHDSMVFVIDVGQSVERDHENGYYFLIADINNINKFFKKSGVDVVTENKLFEEITGINLPLCLKDIELTQKMFIPTRLDDIANQEDIENFVVDNSQKSLLSHRKGPRREIRTREERKQLLKENKKNVKEHNKLRRALRIPKKQKERMKRIKRRNSKK